MATLRILTGFLKDSARLIVKGNRWYFAWMAFLLLLIAAGTVAYSAQLRDGLIVTRMRDQVSWGFYIGNFTFLVGVAAVVVGRHVTGDDHHRDRVEGGVGHARGRVGESRAQMGQEHARLPRSPGVAVRGVGGHLLVA